MKKTIIIGRVIKTATIMLLVLVMAVSPAMAAPYSASDDAEVSVQTDVSEPAGTM